MTRKSDNLIRNYRRITGNMIHDLEKHVIKWCTIRNKEVLKLTPMDTGHLRDSMYLQEKVTYNGFRVESGFLAPHAPIVHEWSSGEVTWTETGTGPKFLQEPYYSKAQLLPRYLKMKTKLRK